MSEFNQPQSDIVEAQVVPGLSGVTIQELPKTSLMAIFSVVFGVLSCVFSCFTGIIGLILGIISLISISNSKGRVTGSGIAIAGIALSIVCSFASVFFAGMLLPAVQQVREAARRTTVENHVRQVIMAQHLYHESHGKLPSSTQNLSWRVHVLPQLGYQELYDRFNLDEPWDSPHNQELMYEMPSEYLPLGGKAEMLGPELTLLLRPVGNGAFPLPGSTEDAESKTFDNLIGFETVLIVEVNPDRAVPWTKPADWEFNPNDPFDGIGQMRTGMTLTGMADGTTKEISNDIVPKMVKKYFTIDSSDNMN